MRFNCKPGSATQPGSIPKTRLLTKEHSDYPIYFDALGNNRSEEEVKQLIFGNFYRTNMVCKCGIVIRFVKLNDKEVKTVDEKSLTPEELTNLNNGMEVCFDKDRHAVHVINECTKK